MMLPGSRGYVGVVGEVGVLAAISSRCDEVAIAGRLKRETLAEAANENRQCQARMFSPDRMSRATPAQCCGQSSVRSDFVAVRCVMIVCSSSSPLIGEIADLCGKVAGQDDVCSTWSRDL